MNNSHTEQKLLGKHPSPPSIDSTKNINKFSSPIVSQSHQIFDINLTNNFGLSKTPKGRYYKRIILCPFCPNKSSTPQLYWDHFFICVEQKDIDREVINSILQQFKQITIMKTIKDFQQYISKI